MPERDAALYAAPGTLAWLEYVDLWRIGCGRSNYTTDGRLALDIHAAAAARPPTAAPAEPQAPSLVGMLDLTSATIDELRDIQNIAKHVGAAAYAYTWGPRCGTRGGRYGAVEPNGIGKLMHWLGDALTDVETAVDKEVVRRMPDSHADCETRLSMRAVAIIDNGDPDQTAAFARELLAHAEAERAGR
ncbi:hypothetical protein MKL09_00275 [Methylobacterium sp. J-048]|uniref:hypothetical protein n=1 Tax=Methylobacterium sp. J-048 TaxID=2836635 RepID=UPI001FB9BC26|nr:hypothetical protein [Methylobacterium sp. J-048]MCJ2054998.1 hypothetical protein [Methylobacterium sp. J-048]